MEAYLTRKSAVFLMAFRYFKVEPVQLRGEGNEVHLACVLFRAEDQTLLSPDRATALCAAHGGSLPEQGPQMALQCDNDSKYVPTAVHCGSFKCRCLLQVDRPSDGASRD